jgi:hypothetical protein
MPTSKLKAHDVLLIDDPQIEEEQAEDNFMGLVFEHINSITDTKKRLPIDEDWLKKAIWVIIKGISYNPDCVLLCNEANKMPTARQQYDFLFNAVHSRKRMKQKWPKRKEDDERLLLIQKKYNCNRQRGMEIINVLGDKKVNNIVKKMNKIGGVE